MPITFFLGTVYCIVTWPRPGQTRIGGCPLGSLSQGVRRSTAKKPKMLYWYIFLASARAMIHRATIMATTWSVITHCQGDQSGPGLLVCTYQTPMIRYFHSPPKTTAYCRLYYRVSHKKLRTLRSVCRLIPLLFPKFAEFFVGHPVLSNLIEEVTVQCIVE